MPSENDVGDFDPEEQIMLQPIRPGGMPTLIHSNAKAAFLNKFEVPCEDSETAREVVRSLGGAEAARARQAALHRRHHSDTATLDLSLWLPHEDQNWKRVLVDFAASKLESAFVTVELIGKAFSNPETGRLSQTFRLSYYQNDRKDPLELSEAKKGHQKLAELITQELDGVECR